MMQAIVSSNSILDIYGYHFMNEVLAVLTESSWHFEASFLNLSEYFCLTRTIEWHFSCK